MATVFDVADYILGSCGPMSAMKLQKLVYYAQAWSLVWDEQPLFEDDFEAWANGPVVRSLYERHRGCFRLEPGFFGGDPAQLTSEQIDSIDRVLSYYGDKDPQWLSDLTHLEAPWREARRGLSDGDRGMQTIPKDMIAEYYGSL